MICKKAINLLGCSVPASGSEKGCGEERIYSPKGNQLSKREQIV